MKKSCIAALVLLIGAAGLEAQTTIIPVYNSGSHYEDRNLLADATLGNVSAPVMNVGETAVDTSDSRPYVPFSISAANATLIQNSASVTLNLKLTGLASVSGYTVDLYGFSDRGAVLAAQTGDYSGGTLLASSVLTSAASPGWVSFDVTDFAIAQVDRGNAALAFKFRIQQAGLPVADGKQNNYAFASADNGALTAPFLQITQQTADATTLGGKVMAGYQGWFRTPGDGSGHGWHHWSLSDSSLTPSNVDVDMWPDMSGYTAAECTAATGFTDAGGNPSCLYSAVNARTVRRHFQWMEQYHIDGIWFQLFGNALPGGSSSSLYPSIQTVMNNVRAAATATGRTWAVNYDTTGMTPATLVGIIEANWQSLVDAGYTSDARYLHQGGLPVVQLYGFFHGAANQPLDTAMGTQLISFFKAAGPYQAVVMGVGTHTWNAVGATDPAFKAMILSMDAYMPWNTGNLTTDGAGVVHANTSTWVGDKAACDAAGVLWVPDVYPGFSANHAQGLPWGQDTKPRRGGNFLWEQFAALYGLGGIDTVFIGMFDEVNEGTAVFKITNTPPTQTGFVTYDGFPSNWYLRLVGVGENMLYNGTPISTTIPISP